MYCKSAEDFYGKYRGAGGVFSSVSGIYSTEYENDKIKRKLAVASLPESILLKNCFRAGL